jgi:hypothetical protein
VRSNSTDRLCVRPFRSPTVALTMTSLMIVAIVGLVPVQASASTATAKTWTEMTTAGGANTWTDYSDAGGTEGPHLAQYDQYQVSCRVQGFMVEGGDLWWYRIASSPRNNNYYASADSFFNGGDGGSPLPDPIVDPKVRECAQQPERETTGSSANTWSDFKDAGGTAGEQIADNQTVAVTCRTIGFIVSDGNRWWYRIASSPWDDEYYASADAFYNNGQTSGSLIGTPFYDPKIKVCRGTTGPYPETTGGTANTWTDYKDAGGIAGKQIADHQTVDVTCRVKGFKVADGNKWWYEIASSPWDDDYYVPADAFYNNGDITGSLIGTPFYDPAVPVCSSSS